MYILYGGALYEVGANALQKSAKRYTVYWRGIPIAVTHRPGDERHGRKLKYAYAYVEGSGKDGLDGEAIDLYLGRHLDSPYLFRVEQIKPETGEMDEHKWIVGARSLKEAEAIYLSAMPRRFMRVCEEVPSGSLDKYSRV